jgi:hypothetical protein
MHCQKCGRKVFRPEQFTARLVSVRCTGCGMTPGRCRCSDVLHVSAVHKVLSEDPRGCEHPRTMVAQCVRVSRALQELREG